MLRYFAIALFAAAPLTVAAWPVEPVAQCGIPIDLLGGDTVLAQGVTARGRTDLASRIEEFFRRTCRTPPRFEVSATAGASLLDELDQIVEGIRAGGPRVWILHYPMTDIQAGAAVGSLVAAYRRVVDACASTGSTCIVGGQQPVNLMDDARSDAQRELERRASAEFGESYLPLYRHFESEFPGRRLMLPMDSGDGRRLGDRGHELLFSLYRNRLIELELRRNPAR